MNLRSYHINESSIWTKSAHPQFPMRPKSSNAHDDTIFDRSIAPDYAPVNSYTQPEVSRLGGVSHTQPCVHAR